MKSASEKNAKKETSGYLTTHVIYVGHLRNGKLHGAQTYCHVTEQLIASVA
jgi:hypothetical protein